MRSLRRILTAVAITLGVIALGGYWVAPVVFSLDTAVKAPLAARVVPTDLKDLSVSQVPGTKLSYLGYEFEVPWNDLDETQTKLVRKENPYMAGLAFRSGLHLIVSVSSPRVFPNGFSKKWKVSTQSLESVFGHGAAQSDYSFLKNLYEFTPDRIHIWSLSPSVHYREQMLMTMKTVVLSGSSADTGIFNIRNQTHRGFQLGDPQSHPQKITVDLYSDESSIELTFAVDAPHKPAAVTQPEVNRIVQSLRKIPQYGLPARQAAEY